MLKSRYTGVGRLIAVLAALLALAPLGALAGRAGVDQSTQEVIGIGTCHFEISAQSRMKTMALQNNCVTTETIVVPHGTMLDGNGYTIKAVSPENGPFLGAVITNEPVTEQQKRVTINVTNVKIDAGNLENGCYTNPDTRLRGVWLNGASGSVTNVTIQALNRGPSGCQEGNAIEAVNYDEGSRTTHVTIANNTVLNWMKTGIVANLNVDARIMNNFVGASSNEEYLAPNSIQVGFGASADVLNNNVHGSQWLGDSDWTSAGILFYEAGSVEVSGNTLNSNPYEGNAEIGFYIIDTDNSRFMRNTLFDHGEDTTHPNEDGVLYDIGIYADCTSTGNVFGANQVRGFNVATDICYDGPGRGESATSMTTLSRGVSADDVPAPPPAPLPFI